MSRPRPRALILPFELDQSVRWASLPLDATVWLGYKHPIVRDEFRRYTNRELLFFMAAVWYAIACYAFPLVLLDVGVVVRYIDFAAGALLAILAGVDLVLHFKSMPSVRTARRRQLVALTLSCLIFVPSTWGAFIGYYERCSNADFPLRSLVAPNLTPWRIQQYCRSIINPLLAVTIRTVSMFPFPPALALLPMGSCLVQDALSRLAVATYGHQQESGEDIAVKTVGMVLLCSMSMAMMISVHRMYMSSFESELATAVARERSTKLEEEVDQLLCAMLPLSTLARLAAHCEVNDWTPEASVLHSDIVQFTAWSGSRKAHEVVAMLNCLWIDVDRLAETSGVSKVKTVGDAYWAVCGLPDEDPHHAENLCDFGHAMLERLHLLNGRHREWGTICMRVGIHSGGLWGGVLGTRQLSYEVFGPTSALAEAVEKAGVPSRVAVSGATLSRLGLSVSVGEPYSRLELAESGARLSSRDEIYLLQRMTIADHRNVEREAVMRLNRRSPDPSLASELLESDCFDGALCGSTIRSAQKWEQAKSAEAKRQRLRFAADRAALAASTTVEEVEARYSERRWRSFLLDFKDPTVELEYRIFASGHSYRTRRLERIFVLLLEGYVAYGITMNRASFPVHTAILLSLSGAISVTDLLVTRAYPHYNRTQLRSSLVMSNVAALMLLVAAGTAPAGTSVATNDITYLYSAVAAHTAFANLSFASAASLSLFNLLVLVPLTIGMMRHSVMLFEVVAVVILTCLVQSFGLIVREKRYRRLFLEAQVAAYFQRQQERRRQEQRALLELVVPPHVVPALIDWLSADLDVSRTVMFTYPLIAIAFVRFTDADPMGGALDGSRHSLTNMDRASATPNVSTSAYGDSFSSISLFTGSRNRPSYGNHQLFEIHRAVDDVMARYPVVCKIKSFGDSIMLATPLVESVEFALATRQLMAAIWELRVEVSPQLQAGIHCGEAVGAVLGRSRLCFDVFGDTVNVASRTMTSGSAGQVLVTEEFFATLNGSTTIEADNDAPCAPLGAAQMNGARVGTPREVPAKGKGRLVVRELVAFERQADYVHRLSASEGRAEA